MLSSILLRIASFAVMAGAISNDVYALDIKLIDTVCRVEQVTPDALMMLAHCDKIPDTLTAFGKMGVTVLLPKNRTVKEAVLGAVRNGEGLDLALIPENISYRVVEFRGVNVEDGYELSLYGDGIFKGSDPTVGAIRKFFETRNIPRVEGTVSSRKCQKTVDSYRRIKNFVFENAQIEVREQGQGISVYGGCGITAPYSHFRLDVKTTEARPTVALASKVSAILYEIFGISPAETLTLSHLSGDLKLKCVASKCVVSRKPIEVSAQP